jgi:hypothetical protein
VWPSAPGIVDGSGNLGALGFSGERQSTLAAAFQHGHGDLIGGIGHG